MSTTSTRSTSRWRRFRGVLVILMGATCVIAPFVIGKAALSVLSLFLVIGGALELIETFSVSDEAGQRSTYLSGFLSIIAGVLLENDPQVVLRGVVVVVGVSVLIDGLSQIWAGAKATWNKQAAATRFLRGLIDLGLATALLGPWATSRLIALAVVVGVRMVLSGWAMLTSHEPPTVAEQLAAGAYPDFRLGLPPHPYFAEQDAILAVDHQKQLQFDTRWYWILIATFLPSILAGWPRRGTSSGRYRRSSPRQAISCWRSAWHSESCCRPGFSGGDSPGRSNATPGVHSWPASITAKRCACAIGSPAAGSIAGCASPGAFRKCAARCVRPSAGACTPACRSRCS
jgi:uncharacterized membrane protein HdeD (DUF308 family)